MDIGNISMEESLLKLDEVYAKVPKHIVIFGHALAMAALTRGRYEAFFLLDYWVSYMSSFGGNELASMIMNEPGPMVSNNLIGVCWTVAWYLMHYCPWDLAFRAYSFTPIRLSCRCLSALGRAMIICSKTASAHRTHPSVVVGPIFVGTLAGSGGRLLMDSSAKMFGIETRPPAEIKRPSWIIRSAFLVALFFYVSVCCVQALTAAEARAVAVSVLVMHCIASELLGPVDLTAPLNEMFHKVSCIPKPEAQKPTKAVSKSKKAKKSE
mmetsp:Transcript_29387/g.56420  ORF Transcript_29387/g.56420 Transcript_29387/m.56420 type:complete len:267 (-) Transcript_29387:236-1036(-)|eukprot:CAMPEP_0114227558 /NCGR_PEP_ID=MMETSP0058-20121206/1856_1 /TAXON_ID=36894 /ORGANISM="Pyramimonas parkeae, CCMP726" /LENGTH=266 /DNA_ID=CAMNT_0001338411 /DNA_START=238 /DNA_END=1038 /DNA_ORIENTATION=+